jgi:phosphoglycolate phosphatase-like HAD superfamily hydrolase
VFVVLDIDGVLADVRHRLHHLARRPKNWDAFFAAAADDPPLDIGVDFARRASSTHQIVYLTGRPERLRTTTSAWLKANGLPAGPIVMRSDGDRRPGAVVKIQALRRLGREGPVDLLVDDDRAVVEAARAAGFPVQHADWMPDETDPRPDTGSTSDADENALFGVDLLTDAQQRDGRT